MVSAGFALQRAVYETLIADHGVLAALGGPHVFDDVPQGTAFPYVTFGRSTLRDWSTGSDRGEEHLVTLHVWSRGAGRKLVHDVMAALRDALHERALNVSDHRLINLRHVSSDARRESDGQTYHGVVRYRAVTEPTV
ncbi:MAG: DUF3168 domain-containing protein [Pseudomonadota bacterium]